MLYVAGENISKLEDIIEAIQNESYKRNDLKI